MNEDSLERLKKRLYKEGETFRGRFKEPELSYKPDKVTSAWEESRSEEALEEVLKESRLPKMKFFIWAAVIFVLGISTLAALYLFGGFGVVSARNIDITVSAPEEVAGGDLVRWEVSVHNRNDVKLASAELAFEYPAGSRPVNKSVGLTLIERVSLGEISAGGVVKRDFAAYIFGPENFEGVSEVVLEYRTEGSNAVFENTAEDTVKLTRSPVGVSISAPKEINAGREISFEVKYVSNATDVIKGLTLDMIYPEGFTFKNALPKPAEGQSRWALGDLAPGETRSVTIFGTFEGEDAEEKNVVAQVGVLEGKNLSVYGSGPHTFVVKRMFIDLAARVNGRDDLTALKVGDSVNIELVWKNNLLQAVRNVVIEVELSGSAIDERTLSVFSGSYRGFEKKVVWSPSSLGDLSLIEPGASGRANFSFRVLDAVALGRNKLVNPTIKLKGQIRPQTQPQGLEGIDISGGFEMEVKIETSLQLSGRGFYYSSLFPGSGPLPPKVGKETVYTVTWSLANLSSNASGVMARASLPAYVRWKGAVRPSGEQVSYDPVKSEVVWRPGSVEAGVGINQPAKEVSFQIGIIPSVDQIGTSPVLLFDITVLGRDDFTGNELSDSESSFTTNISEFDPGVKPGDGIIAQ